MTPDLTKSAIGPAAVTLALLLFSAWPTWLAISPGLETSASARGAHDTARMVMAYSTLPRLATAFLAGAALSLSGALFQHILRNPLASPTTLGVSAGANLTLVLAMLFVPAVLDLGRDAIAFVGSGLAAAIVMSLGARRGFSPFSLVLSGMVISLWCGSLAAILTLLNDRYLASLFIWGAGSLSMQSWDIPIALGWKLFLLGGISLVIIRPMTLLELGENQAVSLGVRLKYLRFAAITIAVALAAVVTSAVGVIGFIGLVGPIVTRLVGARRTASLLIWSSLIGGAMLFLTDTMVQALSGSLGDSLPTGAVTAVFGSPLLLFVLPRLKIRHRVIDAVRSPLQRPVGRRRIVAMVAICLLLVVTLGLFFGRTLDGGWTWLPGDLLTTLLPIRAPKVAAALVAGAMLSVAGVILQRLTGNEMASPEVLGISAGATFGLAVAVFLLGTTGWGSEMASAAAGALAILAVILLSALRSGLAPERVLLAGIALSAMVDAVVGVLAATGDPRALLLLRWMSGSTYAVQTSTVVATAVTAIVLIGLSLMMRRWLDLFPLGPVPVSALGVSLGRSRLILFSLAGLMSAAATICVGPLTFIGLMGPHLAHQAGLRRAAPQMLGAAATGAVLMIAADWVGRTIAFPYQVPAGLVSALIGAPFLMLMLRRKAQA